MNKFIKAVVYTGIVCVSTLAQAQVSAWPHKVLVAPFQLHPGEQIYSNGGRYYLVLQASDGNAVIYETATQKVLWSNYTLGTKLLAFQTDGNFVAYKNEDGTNPIWNSRTGGREGAVNQMFFYDEGQLLLKSGNNYIWSSNQNFLTGIQHENPNGGGGGSTCTTASRFPVCVGRGYQFQFSSFVLACSVSEAIHQAQVSGASFGAC